jgi:RNA polymerase sigma-70 factor (ECF subfamily)
MTFSRQLASSARRRIALLDPGATVTADGGGLVSAALQPVQGAEQIAGYLLGLASRAPGRLRFLERTVNGQPGLVAQQDSVIVTVFAFDVEGDRITRIWAVRNPDKLRPWTTGA